MSEWWETLEGIARWYLDEAQLYDPPIRPRALTVAWGRRLMPTRDRVHLASTDEIIFYDPTVAPHRQVGDTFHELGHCAMDAAGFDPGPDLERFAGYLAGALACPRERFLRDLRETRWDLPEMVRRYGCSWEIVARRIADTRSAAVCIVDNLDEVSRYTPPWIVGRIAKAVTPVELELAELAAGAESGVHTDGNLMTGYIVPESDTPWMRIITVCGIEELEARMMKRVEPRVHTSARRVVGVDD